MARRSTRSAAAAEPAQLSSPPPTPAPSAKRASRTSKSSSKDVPVKQEDLKQEPGTPATSPKTRKRGRATIKPDDDLPHNLGDLPTPSGDPPTKRSRTTKTTPKKTSSAPTKTPAKKAKKPPTTSADELSKIASKAGLVSPSPAKDGQKKKKKNINYKLTPGTSPYPDYPRPTKEECHEVVRLLSKVHGKVTAPKQIRAPSLTTAGCGEVPSVLDALIRTRLSAATTGTNSSRAFQGLVRAFGTIQRGTGRGSVDWDAVRRAELGEVFEAIKCGGLAGSKSKDIKAILDLVWAENRARAEELKSGSAEGGEKGEGGVKSEEQTPMTEGEDEERLDIIHRAEQGVLSLDHLHLLTSEAAFDQLVSYPGIGPKTASCVLLFCLQRPSFAVDTHVFRLCRYLGWVPSDAEAKDKGWRRVERDTTYSHCEVMVPDELKYALHQLLIKHGKTCGRCRAATGMGGEGWKKGCPIEHLVKRHGAKKGERGEEEEEEDDEEKPKRKRGKKTKSESESESEEVGMSSESEGEMSDLVSDGDGTTDEEGSSAEE